jgi:HAMP domain-containing protein
MGKTTTGWVSVSMVLWLAGWASGATVPEAIRELDRDLRRMNQDLTRRIEAMDKNIGELTAAVRRMTAEIERLKGAAQAAAGAKAAATGSEPARARQLDVRVSKDNWGQAGTKDMERVLLAAADQLWEYVPGRQLESVVIRRGTTGPIAMHRRGKAGEYIVKLDWTSGDWPKLADQFAAQFCRILTNYHEEESRKNRWFADALGEAASVFAVKRTAEAWKRTPPSSAWRRQIPVFAKYATDRQNGWAKLPDGTKLADWYKQNAAALSAGDAGRDKLGPLARHLLDAFEADPSRWEALSYLNVGRPGAQDSLKSYLSDWHENVPARHKAFVAGLMDAFGVR